MRVVLSFILGLCAAACTTYRADHYVGTASSYRLAELHEGESHSVVELDYGASHAALHLHRNESRVVPHLGLEATEIGKARAESLGRKPFCGLMIETVEPDSPADAAGLRPGDLIVELDGRDAYEEGHLRYVLDRLEVGEAVAVKVQRSADPEDTVGVELVAEGREEAFREVTEVPLEAPETGGRPHAGLVLRGMPDEWAERLYGQGEKAVVVSAVAVGSPAYHAGLRGGDVIRRVDGRRPEGLRPLVETIRRRGHRGGEMTFEVVRDEASDPFTTTVGLEDYSGTTEAGFPLVFDVEASARTTRWKVGPFGLVGNYRGAYEESPTRESEHESRLSLLLGLIKVRSDDDGSDLRLLWLLHIGG